MFSIKAMNWKGQCVLFGGNDPKHVQKAIPRGLRSSSRVAVLHGFHINLCPLLVGGCPRQYVTGKDVHSDKEAAFFLNPAHLKQSQYDDVGVNLLQFPWSNFWTILVNIFDHL